MAKSQGPLADEQATWLGWEHALQTAELFVDLTTTQMDSACSLCGANPSCLGVSLATACTPNPARITCNSVASVMEIVGYAALYVTTFVYEILDRNFEEDTLGGYSRDTGVLLTCAYEWSSPLTAFCLYCTRTNRSRPRILSLLHE